jgi:hypothetical protein
VGIRAKNKDNFLPETEPLHFLRFSALSGHREIVVRGP